MTAEQKVKQVYPDAYMGFDLFFETYSVYNDGDNDKPERISGMFKGTNEAWEDAAKRLEGKNVDNNKK